MFSASLTFLLITWRRHLLSKNPQSSVRGDEVGKCTVRSACFLVPYAGSIQPKLPEISVQNSIQPGKFSQKKKKNSSTFWGGPLFSVGPVGNFGWIDRAPGVRIWNWNDQPLKHVRSAMDSLISAGLYIFQKPITGGSALRGCQHISFFPRLTSTGKHVPIAL